MSQSNLAGHSAFEQFSSTLARSRPSAQPAAETMGSGHSDGELMDAVSGGCVEAFGELYDRFCNRAYCVAFSVCRDQGRAQDAVQDAFLSLWQSRTSYRSQQGTVAAWLLAVVRYRAIDLSRRNRKHAAWWSSDNGLEEHPAADDVSENVIARDDAERLQASLTLLPDEQQEVITLAFYGHLSHTEIATHLHLPPGTVKGRMRLGLQKLRGHVDRVA